MKFCPDCGEALELRESERRQRFFCPLCQRIHYAQLKVGAGALIEQDGKLSLLQRTHAPFRHCWNLPAGYVEADESPVETVIRETYEETGLRVEESLKTAKKLGIETVGVNAEDASRTDTGNLIEFALGAKENGADRFRYCDTLGADDPITIYEKIKKIAEATQFQLVKFR